MFAACFTSSSDIEKRLTTSGLLYGNVALDAYVQSVADGLRRPDDPESIRMHVLGGPWPNAFVLPNGASYVTTAMLDMLDNEAQLACVLGHEMSHLVERHALLELRSQRTREGWTTALAVLLGAAGAYYGGGQIGSALANLTASAGQLWTMAAVSGYSRDHERAADRQGFARWSRAAMTRPRRRSSSSSCSQGRRHGGHATLLRDPSQAGRANRELSRARG